MTVQVQIITDQQTLLQYLTGPIYSSLPGTFSERYEPALWCDTPLIPILPLWILFPDMRAGVEAVRFFFA